MKAKSPVIIAGQGIRLADAQQEFLAMVKKMDVPVLSTFEGFDMIPSDHPNLIGRIGTIGTRAGNIALQNADWVLCIGSRNNIRQISYNYENYVSRAKDFIIVDIDDAELNKHTVHPTLKVHCDALSFILALQGKLENLNKTDSHSAWLQWCQIRKKRYPVVLDSYKSAEQGINPYVFTEILTRLLPENSVIACANATPSLALFQGGIVKKDQRMICNSGCAAMGYGLPCALGCAAAVSGENRSIICLEGDGSLMMNIQEMQTIASYQFPVKMFLYDNGEYCSIRQTHDNFFHERIGCDMSSGVSFPCWEKIAEAFGWKYYQINSETDALHLIQQILTESCPVLCDVKLTPGYSFAPKLSSRKLPDGTLVSPTLEDMYPFLSREEMKDNIYRGQECYEK